MPQHPWQETIDENTPEATLYRVLQACEGTRDVNYVRAAGEARAELARREKQQRFEEITKQLTAQQSMIESLITSTHELSQQQTTNATQIADRQVKISSISAWAAWGAAIAAFLMLLFNVLTYLFG